MAGLQCGGWKSSGGGSTSREAWRAVSAMCHSPSRCLASSWVRRARMSRTRGSSAAPSSQPGCTASSRCRLSSAAASRSASAAWASSGLSAGPASTRSMQAARSWPLCPVRHHSMTAPRSCLPSCLSARSSRSSAYAGTSLASRENQVPRISSDRRRRSSAKAWRTRRYSCRSTTELRCPPSSPWPEVHSPVNRVISRATCRKFLLTLMACRKYAPQKPSGPFCKSLSVGRAEDAMAAAAAHRSDAFSEVCSHALRSDASGEGPARSSPRVPAGAGAPGQRWRHVSSSARSNCAFTRERQSTHWLLSKRPVQIAGSARARTASTASVRHCTALRMPSTWGGRAPCSSLEGPGLERFASWDTRSKTTSRIGESFSSSRFENMASAAA
mmetsp:Transcript_97030/g.301798  ORF Transcript_97030/g.301798 Transcript_97030/m.301798 type:complete len:386 (+) Transcript_97030:2046-3203(+)